jgi:diguanylate cyclase (GGDEF)-like protein
MLKLQHRAERQRLEALISKNTVLETETNHYRQLSMLDQLTGVLNRHGLSEYIQKRFPDEQLKAVALVIIDVDFFKKINDNYGHDGGDKVLARVADTIRENIRTSDTVARWGGEEFVVILPDTRLEEAHVVAEKLRSLVANTSFEFMPDLQTTISLGVGAIVGLEPFHMLFRRVDVALYQAKAQGRNRVVVAQE